MKKNFYRLLILLFLSIFNASCSQKKVFLSDRAVLAYSQIESYKNKNGIPSLILLDYHNNVNLKKGTLSSLNWVSRLIKNNIVDEVYWISGRTMELPNKESRKAWLLRNLNGASYEDEKLILEKIKIYDWQDIQNAKLNNNLVLHLGFAEFTKDPGPDPDLYIKEICNFIHKKKIPLTTISFSSVYLNAPEKGWHWLETFCKSFRSRAQWVLAADSYKTRAESADEERAWLKWKNDASYQSARFFPGAYIWQQCPRKIQKALLAKNIIAADSCAQDCIDFWNTDFLAQMDKELSKEKQENLFKTVWASLNQHFAGAQLPAVSQVFAFTDKRSRGLAVRFRNAGIDRGCLAMYCGIIDFAAAVPYCVQYAAHDSRYKPITPDEADSLCANVSVFASWQKMETPLDFIPGADSLILETKQGSKTLLQSAVAMERAYSKEEFLSRLSNKANLGLEGWKKDDLVFYKATSLSLYAYGGPYFFF